MNHYYLLAKCIIIFIQEDTILKVALEKRETIASIQQSISWSQK